MLDHSCKMKGGLMSQDNEHSVLMKIEGAPSRYMTWVDYSIRMKQSTVSVEDSERFYRK